MNTNTRPPSPPSRGVMDGSLRSSVTGHCVGALVGLRLAALAASPWGGPAEKLLQDGRNDEA